jgi:D-glycero-D-manno-heptose 1,7-bisphosphate phosphatase
VTPAAASATQAVFLDRDGVLNEAVVRNGRPHPPASLDELRILPGAPEACHELRLAGFALVIVTNQPDIARGTTTPAAVDAMNDALRNQIEVDAVYVCPHDDADRCTCRKPEPGLLLKGAAELGLDLGSSYMVGDRWRDIEAGQRAGCRTVHVDRRYHERGPSAPDMVVADLPQATRWILEDSNSPGGGRG